MTFTKRFKQTALFSTSALALAVASASHGYDIEVGDTDISIYGYAKLDLIYDVDSDLGDKSVGYGNIALDGDSSSTGHTGIHAAESRIGFSTATPMAGSDLKTTIEGDFYGGGADSNAAEFRLRQAFGEWNGILAGQTWTNFASFIPGTPTIDFTGPGGRGILDRQAQLRYTTGGFSVAVEDPDKLGGNVNANISSDTITGFEPDGTPITTTSSSSAAKNKVPDLTARYEGASGNFSYAASGVMRYLEYDTNNNADADASWSDDTATGWGIALAGALEVTEDLTVRAGVSHGDGIGGYVDSNPYQAPAYVDSNGNLETVEATGGTVGASLKAGPGAFNLVYSVATADLDDAEVADSTNDTFESVWANYIWSPASTQNIAYGVEVGQHSRETVGGDDGDAIRVQGMVKYSF
ncbi:DcaP family trimeric outer membrane transporter [Halomonas sp. HL-93]|uniref:DcaP family trimeric outer membrane transporter n=1 Tax=Halomonas sp. HL-93 TaxID=1666906 RepID=UPI0006DA6003|nr:DcaP family trimeric outer membrane transporter [Halomonas sp. HL-93]KPQ22475.1 MAG: hypothetical protein HLUCCO06_08085 [Halomonas sp. HL-93]SBR49933.1 hypothetical protein GA0071314_2431 [Halomonas sp. HL-93]